MNIKQKCCNIPQSMNRCKKTVWSCNTACVDSLVWYDLLIDAVAHVVQPMKLCSIWKTDINYIQPVYIRLEMVL